MKYTLQCMCKFEGCSKNLFTTVYDYCNSRATFEKEKMAMFSADHLASAIIVVIITLDDWFSLTTRTIITRETVSCTHKI